MVEDTLSRKSMGSLSHVEDNKKDLVKDVNSLARFVVLFYNSLNCDFMLYHNSESYLVVEVNSKQQIDP